MPCTVASSMPQIHPKAPLPHGTKGVSEVAKTLFLSARITVYMSLAQKIQQELHVLEMFEVFGKQSKAISKQYRADWCISPPRWSLAIRQKDSSELREETGFALTGSVSLQSGHTDLSNIICK